jgi:leucyl aminopeptidase
MMEPEIPIRGLFSLPDPFLDSGTASDAVPVRAVTNAGLDAALAKLAPAQAAYARALDFRAKAGAVVALPGPDGAVALALLGLGDIDDAAGQAMLHGALATALPNGAYRLEGRPDDPTLAAVAFGLGAYRFTAYRANEGAAPRLAMPDGADAEEARRVVDAATLVRDLVNTPANDLGPTELAEAVRKLAERHGAAFSEVKGEALAAGLPLVHTVGAAAGTTRAPRLIEINWGDPGHSRVTLVGKGVVFDTGGLDIKTSAYMLLMKKDMGGAANALGLAAMIMDAGLKVRLRVLIPAVENAISGAAFRPGDIIRSRKGLTVEIGNTDAEGRLILADALAMASEDTPDLLIDLATLTGAARVALGPDVVPFYTADDALAAEVSRHAAATADPMWRMPLWQPYHKLFESKIADVNNAGSSNFAGSITAALFLSRFVADPARWLHADIFAWTPTAQPAKPEGGEAQAIRAIYGMLRERYGP